MILMDGYTAKSERTEERRRKCRELCEKEVWLPTVGRPRVSLRVDFVCV
jgi:hypothetical protein